MSHVFVICKIECITVQLVTQSNKLVQHPKVLEITYNVRYHSTKVVLQLTHNQGCMSLRCFKFLSKYNKYMIIKYQTVRDFFRFYFYSVFHKGSKVSLSKYSGTSIWWTLIHAYNKVLCITNDFLQPGQLITIKCIEQNLGITSLDLLHFSQTCRL